MADTLTTQTTVSTVPSGSIIATDDAGAGGHVQIVKLALSADGSAAPITADASGLLVNLGANNDVTLATLPDTAAGDLAAINASLAGTITVGSHAVTNAGTFAVQEDGAALTALQLIDDIIYADDADWTDGTSKHALVGGLYQSTPQTITDGDVGPLQVTSNGYLITSINGTVTVDGSGVTQPISGTVTANLSATDNAVLDQIEVNTSYGDSVGAGTEAAALRVTIANDSTGLISVDDNGGSLTIDNADITTIAGAVTGTEMQVDIVASLPAGTNAIGTLAANDGVDIGDVTINNASIATTNAGTFAVQEDGAALTALQLIDDIIYTDDADWTDGASKHALVGGLYQSTPQTITDGDVGPLQVTSNGYLITSVSGTVTVDGSGVTQPVSGTVTANLSATDNAVLDQIEVNTSYGDNTGGGAEAGSLRVTIANDSTGVLSVDDNGGSLTIDNADITTIAGAVTGSEMQVDVVAALPAGTNLIGDVIVNDIEDGAGDSIMDTVNDAMRVNIVAGSASGTEYTEDASAPANPAGGAVALVRQDTPATLVDTDGDIVAQRATNYGAAFVQVLDSSGNFVDSFSGSGGTSATDDAAFTAGSGSGTPAMGFFSTDTVDSGDVGVLAMDASRRLLVSIEADNVGIGGGTQFAEDGALGATPTGTLAMARRDDALSTLTPVEDDAISLRTNNRGALWTIHDGDITIADGGNVISTDWNGTAPPIGAGTEAAALRVTVATDSTGVLSIDDNGGSLTTDNAGTFAVQEDGAALTSLQLIDDAIATLGTTTYAEATTKGAVIGVVRNDTLAALAGTDNEIAPLQVNASGALYIQEGAALDVSAATVTVDGSGVTQPVSGTVTANLSATDNAVLDQIELNTSYGDNVGNGTAAGSLRVTVASDTTGVLTVDNAGTFVVQEDGAALTALQLLDDTVVTLGTTTYAEATTKGNVIGAVRNDTLAALAGTDNEIAPLQVNASGALYIQEGAALDVSAATVTVDGSGVTQPVSGTVTANLSATDNAVLDQIEVNTSYGDNTGGGTEAGSLRVTIANDSTGLVSVDDGGSSLTVDGELTVVGNVASASTDTGNPVKVGAVFNTTQPTVTNGQRVNLQANNRGGLIIASGVNPPQVVGSVAHDAADSGNPVKVGGKAYNFDGTAPGTAVAENDRTNFATDVYGRQFVETAHPNYWHAHADYASAQTNASLKTAPGAGLKLYITDIVISNGATAGNITLLDGSGGTVKFEIYPAINGGMTTNLRTPVALTANNALVVTSTTVTTHSVMVTGYTAP